MDFMACERQQAESNTTIADRLNVNRHTMPFSFTPPFKFQIGTKPVSLGVKRGLLSLKERICFYDNCLSGEPLTMFK